MINKGKKKNIIKVLFRGFYKDNYNKAEKFVHTVEGTLDKHIKEVFGKLKKMLKI